MSLFTQVSLCPKTKELNSYGLSTSPNTLGSEGIIFVVDNRECLIHRKVHHDKPTLVTVIGVPNDELPFYKDGEFNPDWGDKFDQIVTTKAREIFTNKDSVRQPLSPREEGWRIHRNKIIGKI